MTLKTLKIVSWHFVHPSLTGTDGLSVGGKVGRLKMPMRALSGTFFCSRHKWLWMRSSEVGRLNENTWHPCGLMPRYDVLDGADLAGGGQQFSQQVFLHNVLFLWFHFYKTSFFLFRSE